MLQELLITLGIAALYFCFSAGMGWLIHATHHTTRKGLLLAIGYSLVLYLPATIFVLRFSVPMPLFRLIIIAMGFTLAAVSAIQPAWFPPYLWDQPYRGGALTLVMGLAAIWGLSFAVANETSTTLLIVLATLSAALASLRTTFQPRNP